MIILTGASGLLGRAIHTEFFAKGESILPLGFSRKPIGGVCLDLRNKEALIEFFKDKSPSLIIHSAAHRQPDVCDKKPAETTALNVQAVKNLCQIAKEKSAKLLLISTDYVFDGKNPPYKTTDKPNPINEYGKSKLMAEEVALASGADVKILRVPVLYGPIKFLGECSLSNLVKPVLTQSQIKQDDFSIRFPTLTSDVANVVFQINQKWSEIVESILQWSSSKSTTKYQITKELLKFTNQNQVELIKDSQSNGGANRPINCELDTGILQKYEIGSESDFISSFISSTFVHLK